MADTVVTGHEVEVSETAADEVRRLLDAIEVVEKREVEGFNEPGAFAGWPEDVRWRLLVLAASVEDYLLHIKRADQDGGEWYELVEVESTSGAGGVTPREACENYFRADVLDVPRSDGFRVQGPQERFGVSSGPDGTDESERNER